MSLWISLDTKMRSLQEGKILMKMARLVRTAEEVIEIAFLDQLILGKTLTLNHRILAQVRLGTKIILRPI